MVVLREAAEALTLSELAAATGLSRPTVEAVLEELRASGIVAPASAANSGGAGRPGAPLRLRRLRGDDRRARHRRPHRALPALRCGRPGAGPLHGARNGAGPPGPARLAPSPRPALTPGITPTPRTVGVAVPGILGPDGRIAQSLAVPALDGLELGAALSDRLDCPVTVENDIKLAALAEHHLAPPSHSIVLLQLGHRIPVAVVVGGEILQGAHRLAGELGSQRGMRWTDSSVRGRLTWSTGDDGRQLLERAAGGDAAAQAEIEDFCAQIAPRLATVLLAIDPERVVVGGGLSRAGETLLAPLRRAVGRLLMTEHAPELVPAHLTTDGALVGALGLGFAHSSSQIAGVPDVPAPWHRFHATLP